MLFLRTDIKEEETAYVVEQTVIDAFAADHHPLTNLVKGHHSGDHGLATLGVVIARHGVAFGVVRAVYKVDSRFSSPRPGERDRWGFEDKPAPELRHVIGTHVRDVFTQGNQYPCRKILDDYPGQATGLDLEPEPATAPGR